MPSTKLGHRELLEEGGRMYTRTEIAATAVVPICPACGVPVRGSLQLRADSIDLGTRLAAVLARAQLDHTAGARATYDVAAAAAVLELNSLAAELSGVHLTCRPCTAH